MRRIGLFLLLSLAWSAHAFAGEPPAAKAPPTIEDMVLQDFRQAAPPQQIVWSPDGSRLIYTKSSGDLMMVEGLSGAQHVLVSSEKMHMLDGPVTGRAGERMIRYHQQSYIWSPDSRNVLFDSRGQLWFFDVDLGVGVQLASTGDSGADNPQFSPNGAYLSYVRDHNLYARGLQATDSVVRLTDSPSESIWNGEVDWVYQEELETRSNYFWAPDSRHVAYLQMDESEVPVYPIVDWLPSLPRVDRQHYPLPGDLNPAVRIGVVAANGGKTKWLRVPMVRGEDYIPRFGWVDERTLWIEVLTRDQKKRILYFADISGKDATPILTQTDDKFLDESYDVKVVGQNILLTGWQDGHTHIYLYRFDATHSQASNAVSMKQLTHGDWDVSAIAGVDLQAGIVYYLSNDGDPLQQQIWAVRMDGEDKHRVSSPGAWHDPVFSRNGKFFADTVSSASIPPVAQLCRNETQCVSLWKSPPSSIARIPSTALELKAADGTTTLYGWLTLPEGNAATHSVPLILNPYGGPGVQTITDRWPGGALLSDQVLATYGFAVLRVDNRGTGNRGREFAQAAFGNFGAVQLSDQLASLDQVLAKYPQLDSDRLGWWGKSWGGTFTLYAMTHSSRFRAGVSIAAVTDWHDYDSIYTERYMGEPAANSAEYSEYSVNDSAKNLQGRLLLLQGTADDNVHFSNVIQLVQKLNDANIPFDLQIYPGATHAFSGSETKIRVYKQVLGHFERYVKSSRGDEGDAQKSPEGEEAR